MNVTDNVINKINKLAKGYVFTISDFNVEENNKEATIKALNRLVANGKIAKLSKGRFYKPEKTIFGDLEPNEYQVAKDLLEKNGKLIGYLSGMGIYNQLGLTTQVSFIIQIGKNETRPAIKRGKYRITFIKQKNNITKENTPLLQVLDAIRYFKSIPDASTEFLITRFLQILKNMSDQELKLMVRLSMKYPPVTRALLGALMEELKKELFITDLKSSLNSISNYKLNISATYLSTAENWNIR